MSKVVMMRGNTERVSSTVLRKVPSRPTNRSVRSREHLLPDEVDALMKAAGRIGRHSLRDRTLILTAYRHGLRVSELVALRWDQIDFKRALMHVNRLKNGSSSTQPIEGDELRLLRRVQREHDGSPFVFITERGGRSREVRSRSCCIGPGSAPVCRSRSIRTCCGMALDTISRMKAFRRERFRPISGTSQSSTQSAIQSCHRRHSRGFGVDAVRPSRDIFS